MKLSAPRRAGFTLTELMAVLVILGVLAAVAIPAFASYAKRSRTSEAVQTLNSLYSSASALYVWERASPGLTAAIVTGCVAEPTPITPPTPNSSKQRFVSTGGFIQLGFRLPDYVYFGYAIQSVGTVGSITCTSSGTGARNVYTFVANGDLDGDGTQSTFELAVASSEANQLYHSRGLYIVNELE